MILFLWLLFAAFLFWAYKQHQRDQANAENRAVSFKARIQYGELEITLHYESRNPVGPNIERAVRGWAWPLSDPKPSAELYAALESEIQRQIPDVTSITVTNLVPLDTARPLTPVHHPAPDRAEIMDAELLLRFKCIKVITARLQWLVQHEPEVAKTWLKGRTVEQKVQDLQTEEIGTLEGYVETSLNGLFHSDDHV